MAKYVITNFGNTRKLPYKGQFYFIAKNGEIETDDKELADALGSYMFIDVKQSENKNKVTVAAKNENEKIKRRKIKGEF